MSSGERRFCQGWIGMSRAKTRINLSGVCRAWPKRERWMKCQLASALGAALALIGPFDGPEHGPKSSERSSRSSSGSSPYVPWEYFPRLCSCGYFPADPDTWQRDLLLVLLVRLTGTYKQCTISYFNRDRKPGRCLPRRRKGFPYSYHANY